MPGIAEFEIPKHYAPTLRANIEFRPGYDESILRPHVTNEGATGEAVSPVQIFGRAKIRLKNDRYGDTPIDEIERFRPWVFPIEMEGGDLLDSIDAVKSLIDPASPIVQAFRDELASQTDYLTIMPAFFGPRFEGKDVTTAVQAGAINFDDTKYKLDVNIGSSGGATPTGMNVAKIKAGIKKFKQLKTIKGNLRKERVKLGITAQQWDELFDDVKAINGDYINGRPIEKGQLPMMFDVDFVEMEDYPKENLDRMLPMWLPSGISHQTWVESTVEIGKDPGKRFNVRVYIKKAAGSTRTMDEKVLKIPCREP
jgi:hypothetical protein